MNTNSADDRQREALESGQDAQSPAGGENAATDPADEMVVENELDDVSATADLSGQDTVDADAPELVEGRKIRVRTWSERARRIAVTMVVAALFGVAGYFLRPQTAASAPEAVDLMEQVRDELRRNIVAQKKLETDLNGAKDELQTARDELADALAAEERAAGEVQAAEKRVAKLKGDLEAVRTAVEPTIQKLKAAEAAAAQNKASAEQAANRAKALTKQLETATAERGRLETEQARLTEQRQRLETDVSGQMQRRRELLELLAVLDLGSADGAGAVAGTPGEMPITAREMIQCMGVPTLVFEQNGDLSMQWGKSHSAVASGDIVMTIDGEPATRALLAQVATWTGGRTDPPAPWRVAAGKPLKYTEVVEMFGTPERVAGTGAQFTAWWPAGAWGRDLSATVVEGVVTKVDGKDADPPKVCALVRQRAAAYAEVTPAVKAEIARAEEAYRQAAEIVKARLARWAELRGRDGESLVRWEMAPLESVGAWVGPSTVNAEAWTVRAAVDGTWQTGDGRSTVQRRYVIVTVQQTPEGAKTLDYAMYAPRQ